MSIDLTDLSAKQLSILIKAAQKQHSVVTKRASIDKVRTALIKAAKVNGYTIEELFAKAPSGRSRKVSTTKKLPKTEERKLAKVSAKYRNPSNKNEIWVGRGKRPRWLTELVASGKKVEDFLIKKR
ncbi:DNA-binding protein [Xylella taiwanensis]|uniref:DNA-binding protein n=1 Tax=Xylella taiwanensis TaxID=1444770 RepID=Z9JLA8_9GAMM|nr:DNA-binding protein [Xylella taiwanensis]EWS78969.1 DNA-binding protein [Xylella taiwanensis]NBI35999.1 DNA-binding protein [Xylella taiwanensis]QKD99008.1 H-NS histone family protein [Xylella taiwanensis]